jgi:mRNA-degrading endonuclease toxin of MazEF toxin-antitoxin module
VGKLREISPTTSPREFPDGNIEYVERVFVTSKKHKPRLVTKTVWVKVTTGVKPSPTQVYTPDHNSKLPFKNCRVNPDTVSKVVDENGDPLVVYHGTDANIDF